MSRVQPVEEALNTLTFYLSTTALIVVLVAVLFAGLYGVLLLFDRAFKINKLRLPLWLDDGYPCNHEWFPASYSGPTMGVLSQECKKCHIERVVAVVQPPRSRPSSHEGGAP